MDFFSPKKKLEGGDNTERYLNAYLTPEAKPRQWTSQSMSSHQQHSPPTSLFTLSQFHSPQTKGTLSSLPGRNEGAAFYEDRFIPCRTDAISRSLFGLKQDEKAVAAVQITGFANAVAAQTAAGSTEGGGRVNAVEILAMEDESDETAQKNKNYSNMLEEQLIFSSPHASSSKKKKKNRCVQQRRRPYPFKVSGSNAQGSDDEEAKQSEYGGGGSVAGDGCYEYDDDNRENIMELNILKFRSPQSERKTINQVPPATTNFMLFGGDDGAEDLSSSNGVCSECQLQCGEKVCTVAGEDVPCCHGRRKRRVIPRQAQKVLDAPGLVDDFYVDVLDWSSQNRIAVCLSQLVYLWSNEDGQVQRLSGIGAEGEEAQITRTGQLTSLRFHPLGQQLLCGYECGLVELWDVNAQRRVSSYQSIHHARVGTMAFNSNCNLFASGSRDRSILIQDIRQSESTHLLKKAHAQEVCGLAWSHNEHTLASGGNDNKVALFNLLSGQTEQRYREHRAAVRALEWSPHQHGVLLTGGGAKDQSICVWNTLSQTPLTARLKVNSQVCKLRFSKNTNEFVSTHGFEHNEINVWKFPSLQREATLFGHDQRVLYLALSPDAQTIVSGAGDETLKFWKIFPPARQTRPSALVSLSLSDIR